MLKMITSFSHSEYSVNCQLSLSLFVKSTDKVLNGLPCLIPILLLLHTVHGFRKLINGLHNFIMGCILSPLCQNSHIEIQIPNALKYNSIQ